MKFVVGFALGVAGETPKKKMRTISILDEAT
jgi:hypothetical protein